MINNAILLLGSNIKPIENLKKAVHLINDAVVIKSRSRVWESEAIGSSGPNFLNMAVEIETDRSADDLKSEVINEIESRLGRVRTGDKYAPRTMDIDLIIYDGEILDETIWSMAFVAQPVSEILPGLINPKDCSSLQETALKLKSSMKIELFNQDLF
jgi:2-amino-4-hydroxy-6-hydroxymethyldihydropteridine diphosphokinase